MYAVTESTTQRRWRYRFCALLVGALCALSTSASARQFAAHATAVPDGDTLWVQPEAGGAPQKLRLQGIDAPEICQVGGDAARHALQQLVVNTTLHIEVRHVDDYGRGLARIRVTGQDLGAVLVSKGHAWSYRWRRSPGPYATQERLARQAGLGLFAHPTPENPADFRKRHGSCHPPR